jgi:hypothetical protein
VKKMSRDVGSLFPAEPSERAAFYLGQM